RRERLYGGRNAFAVSPLTAVYISASDDRHTTDLASSLSRAYAFSNVFSQIDRGARMQQIVLLNPIGGSGKTTIATNLASYFAVAGLRPTLMDRDAQGSSTRWLSKRAKGQIPVHGIAGYERNPRVTRSFATRLPLD